MPITIPTIMDEITSRKNIVMSKLPVLKLKINAEYATTAIPSLNKDSPSMISLNLLGTENLRKVEITAVGSVGEIITPRRNASRSGMLRMKLMKKPIRRADNKVPIKVKLNIIEPFRLISEMSYRIAA